MAMSRFLDVLETLGAAPYVPPSVEPWPTVAIDYETLELRPEYADPADGSKIFDGKSFKRKFVEQRTSIAYDEVDLAYLMTVLEKTTIGGKPRLKLKGSKATEKRGKMLAQMVYNGAYKKGGIMREALGTERPDLEARPLVLKFHTMYSTEMAYYYKEKGKINLWNKHFSAKALGEKGISETTPSQIAVGSQALVDLNDVDLAQFQKDVSVLVRQFMKGDFSRVITKKRKVAAAGGQEFEFGTFLSLSEQSDFFIKNGHDDLARKSIEMNSFASINLYTTVANNGEIITSDDAEVQKELYGDKAKAKAAEMKKFKEAGYLESREKKLILVHRIKPANKSIFRGVPEAAIDLGDMGFSGLGGYLPSGYQKNLEDAGVVIYAGSNPNPTWKEFSASGYTLSKDLSKMDSMEKTFLNVLQGISDKPSQFTGYKRAKGNKVTEETPTGTTDLGGNKAGPRAWAIDRLDEIGWDSDTYAKKMEAAWKRFVEKTATDKKSGTPQAYVPMLGLSSTSATGFTTVPVNTKDTLKQIYLYARDIAAYEIFYDIANRVESARTILIFAQLMSNLRDEDGAAAFVDGAIIAAEIDRKMRQGVADMGKGTTIGDATGADADLTEKQIKDRQKFYKQCALLLNMPRKLRMYYRKEINDKSPNKLTDNTQAIQGSNIHLTGVFNNRIFLAGTGGRQKGNHRRLGNTKDIINMLITPSAEAVKPFLHITPDIASALVPKIRLFKVYSDQMTGNLTETEFVFENFENPQRINKLKSTSYDKGNGAGIKSFNFSFEGSTPATSRNDIDASLKLHFQSFQDFLRKRKTPNKKREWSFSELVIFPGIQEGEIDTRAYNPSNYRIRADVGWHIPQYAKFKTVINPRMKAMGIDSRKSLQQALKRMNKSFYLNMTDHEFDIRPDGTVDMTFTYKAYVESKMKSTSLDALWTPQLRLLREEARRIQDDFEDKVRKKQCTPNELRQLKAALVARDISTKREAYRSIMQRLLDRSLIHQADLDPKAGREFQKLGTFSSRPELGKITSLASQKKATDLDDSENRINFFFMGDLVHTILDCLYEDDGITPFKEIDKTKVILTQFDYRLFLDGEQTTHTSNIADIPISVEFFFEWFTQHVIKPRKVVYPVLYFIRDLTNYLIVEALSEVCVSRGSIQKLKFQTGFFMGLGQGRTGQADPLSRMVNKYSEKPSRASVPRTEIDVPLMYKKDLLPLASDDYGTVPVDQYFNYLVVYPVMNTLLYNGTGNYKDDGASGVHHLNIGSDRGIVKSIKFAKTDMVYVKEARFLRNGFDGKMQLGAVYKATIEMIGNTLFYPGMTVWIDPAGIGDGPEWDPRRGPHNGNQASIANALGFGGYHIVTRVENQITPDKFTSTVTAQFDYSGDGSKDRPVDTKKRPGDKNKKIKRGPENSNIEMRQITQTKCTQIIKEIENEVTRGDSYIKKIQQLAQTKAENRAINTITDKKDFDNAQRVVKVEHTPASQGAKSDVDAASSEGLGAVGSESRNQAFANQQTTELKQTIGDLEFYDNQYVEIIVPNSQMTVDLIRASEAPVDDPLADSTYGGALMASIQEDDFIVTSNLASRVGFVGSRQKIATIPMGKTEIPIHKFMDLGEKFLFNGIEWDPITVKNTTQYCLDNPDLAILFYRFVPEPPEGVLNPPSAFD